MTAVRWQGIAPALALAAVALAAEPAGPRPAPIALRTGDTVQFDLSALPSRYAGEGRATCKGTVVRATGPEEALCERRFRFEVPSGGSHLTYVFRASGGGETPIAIPLTRERRPIDFTAPTDGSLRAPGPVTIPPEVADAAARTTAAGQCGGCKGGGFVLQSHEVTKPPVALDGSPSIRLKVTTTRPASGSPAPAK